MWDWGLPCAMVSTCPHGGPDPMTEGTQPGVQGVGVHFESIHFQNLLVLDGASSRGDSL